LKNIKVSKSQLIFSYIKTTFISQLINK